MHKKHFLRLTIKTLGLYTLILATTNTAQADAIVRSWNVDSGLGLYETKEFKLNHGSCAHCASTPQALWYFNQETIAVPLIWLNNFNPLLRTQDDVKEWYKTSKTPSMPPLVWLGSPQKANGILSADGRTLTTADDEIKLALTPKIEGNRSYYNSSSTQYFAGRNVSLRGKIKQDTFLVKSIWPSDYNLDLVKLLYQPLNANETLSDLIRSSNGGANVSFSARILYKKPNLTSLSGKPVLSFVLNGAQSDDDEAHGGHFAVATGRFGPHGEWNDWLVNNFYDLGTVSEKGIIAATLPMESYQGDLNSGQSWYRPSYMLIAVLKNERNASEFQSVINRVMHHFYRQDFLLQQANANCAGISLETLRSIDWHIPTLGATNQSKAILALPYKIISDMSLESGLKTYDYLSAEQTNLLPFVAFEAIGNDLLNRITHNKTKSQFEANLADDLEAIIYVHLPQYPSSRAMGLAPVASVEEYIARTPADISQWKRIPLGPRIFPETLKDKNAPSEPLRPAYNALMAWIVFIVIALFGLFKLIRARLKHS